MREGDERYHDNLMTSLRCQMTDDLRHCPLLSCASKRRGAQASSKKPALGRMGAAASSPRCADGTSWEDGVVGSDDSSRSSSSSGSHSSHSNVTQSEKDSFALQVRCSASLLACSGKKTNCVALCATRLELSASASRSVLLLNHPISITDPCPLLGCDVATHADVRRGTFTR